MYLFQMTRNRNRPVGCQCERNHISYLEKSGLVNYLDSGSMHLVFVVSNGMVNYKKQSITADYAGIDLNSLTVRVDPRIGPGSEEKLKSVGVETVPLLEKASVDIKEFV